MYEDNVDHSREWYFEVWDEHNAECVKVIRQIRKQSLPAFSGLLLTRLDCGGHLEAFAELMGIQYQDFVKMREEDLLYRLKQEFCLWAATDDRLCKMEWKWDCRNWLLRLISHTSASEAKRLVAIAILASPVFIELSFMAIRKTKLQELRQRLESALDEAQETS